MKASEALDKLNPERWAKTPFDVRLRLLGEIRKNLKQHSAALATADTQMKNTIMDEVIYTDPVSMLSTVVPMANTISACIDLYRSLARGRMPEPISVSKVTEDLHDVHVFPSLARDKLLYADRKDRLRVRGTPTQTSPDKKPAGIIAVLGAGNYSSSLEMIKALFLENCAVVHKPHRLNEETDKIWEKIMQPLVEHGALSFCASDQGPDLSADPRLYKIYFTGGSATAQAIEKAASAQLVSECGGNNPCIITPGDRPWTDKEITHQAIQIATMAKLNGGAVCGRVQTVITSAHWPQRQDFVDALAKALKEDTPAAGSYYPGSKETFSAFSEAYPEARLLQPEDGKCKNADILFVTGADTQSYGITHEAFCQIVNETPLDAPASAETFLPAAVAFCNDQLLGTLGSSILIDEDTKKTHASVLEQAITDMRYGAVAINTMPPFVFLSPFLTWGGNEEDGPFVSGRGNFGNVLCFENVEKSIIEAGFMSPGHMLNTNKGAFDAMALGMARYSLEPGWINLLRLMAGAMGGASRAKDF